LPKILNAYRGTIFFSLLEKTAKKMSSLRCLYMMLGWGMLHFSMKAPLAVLVPLVIGIPFLLYFIFSKKNNNSFSK
jgi:hypothetical protein